MARTKKKKIEEPVQEIIETKPEPKKQAETLPANEKKPTPNNRQIDSETAGINFSLGSVL